MHAESRRVAQRVQELLREHPDRSQPPVPGAGASDPAHPLWVDEDSVDEARLDEARLDEDRLRPGRSRSGSRPGSDPAGSDSADPAFVGGEREGSALPGLLQRLAARVPVRLDPGRRAAAAVGVAVLAAGLLTGLWLLSHRPRVVPVSGAPPISGAVSPVGISPAVGSTPVSTPAGSAAVVPSPPARVVVDVAGKVRRPGLYRLPSGARVDDALRAAGGPLPKVNLTSLNLAARVVDGQQIVVGAPGAAAAPAGGATPPPAAGTSGGTPAQPVDLNTATVDQLEALPGIGPVLAQHILDWRTAHGAFATVDQLNDVSGIGEVKFAALNGLVTV